MTRSDNITVSTSSSSTPTIATVNANTVAYQLVYSRIVILRLIFDTVATWNIGVTINFTLDFPDTLTPFRNNGYSTGAGYSGTTVFCGGANFVANTRSVTCSVRALAASCTSGYQPNITFVLRT